MKVVSERIGHSNDNFTMATYTHVRAEADHEAAQQAADFLLGDVWEETCGGLQPAKLVTIGHKNGPRRNLRGPFQK